MAGPYFGIKIGNILGASIIVKIDVTKTIKIVIDHNFLCGFPEASCGSK